MDKITRYEKRRPRKKSGFSFKGGIVLVVLLAVLAARAGSFLADYFTSSNTTTATASVTSEAEKATAAENEAQAQQSENSAQEAAAIPEDLQAAGDEYYIVIKKSEFKLYLMKQGNVEAEYGCALGKATGQKEISGDMKTPDGVFPVDEICDASAWTHDFGDGKGEIEGAYGPWFLSLDTSELSEGKWGGIGIHGTHDPNSIGTLASEGCIRLQNKDIEALKQCVKVGTLVKIEE